MFASVLLGALIKSAHCLLLTSLVLIVCSTVLLHLVFIYKLPCRLLSVPLITVSSTPQPPQKDTPKNFNFSHRLATLASHTSFESAIQELSNAVFCLSAGSPFVRTCLLCSVTGTDRIEARMNLIEVIIIMPSREKAIETQFAQQ